MPNWCENDLVLSGESGVLACLDAIRGDVEKAPVPDDASPAPIDFNKIVPMPPSLNIADDSDVDMAYAAWHGDDEALLHYLKVAWVVKDGVTTREHLQAWLLKNRPKAQALGDAYADNLRLYGAKGWYDWRYAHWGTKWNAAGASLEGGATDQEATLHFDTAWSPPKLVIEALGKKFPALHFEMRYFECGVGYNGLYVVEDGEEARDESGDYFGDRGG